MLNLTSDEVFAQCEAECSDAREGYWSIFAVLAWVVSRDGKFVAATQLYEERQYANRGGLHSESAWTDLGKICASRYGKTFEQAEAELRVSLEAGKLEGGVASDMPTWAEWDREEGQHKNILPVERHEWIAWQRMFEAAGVQLLPNRINFRWPSEHVRAAFPYRGAEEHLDTQTVEIDGKQIPVIGHSGGAGRPTIMPLIKLKLEERKKSGVSVRGKRNEAAELHRWATNEPALTGMNIPTIPTILNSLRAELPSA